jgi:hypothetical protein
MIIPKQGRGKIIMTPQKGKEIQWHGSILDTCSQKIQDQLSARKIIAIVCWDQWGILLIDSMQQESTINAERKCETMEKLKSAMCLRCPGLPTKGVVLLRSCATHHTPAHTHTCAHEWLRRNQWELLKASTLQTRSSLLWFLSVWAFKAAISARHFNTDEDVQRGVGGWLLGLSPDPNCKDMDNLITWWDKRLNMQGKYIEKQYNYVPWLWYHKDSIQSLPTINCETTIFRPYSNPHFRLQCLSYQSSHFLINSIFHFTLHLYNYSNTKYLIAIKTKYYKWLSCCCHLASWSHSSDCLYVASQANREDTSVRHHMASRLTTQVCYQVSHAIVKSVNTITWQHVPPFSRLL